MIECVVVDDEMGAVNILSDYIQQTADLNLKASFRDAVEALNFLTSNQTDLLFLDIDMPNLSGMQLAELLQDKGIMVIFSTAYSEFAVESYEKNAVDYLLKPVPYNRFLSAADKVRNRKKQINKKSTSGTFPPKIFVKSGSQIHQLNLKNLLYMKKDGHYIEFNTTRGKILSRMNMKELLNSLPPGNCSRNHKSYVVVMDKIETIDRHDVIIAGKEIPIGQSYRKEFLQRIKYAGK